jgi:hypothetical protein
VTVARLSEAEKTLITAGVCGHLSADETAALRVLIDENADAKKLYTALCRDRDRIAALRKVRAPESVRANVLARVQSRPIIVPPKIPTASAGWLPYAVAASLLVAAGGIYLATANRTPRHEVADKTPQAKPAPLPDPSAAVVAAAGGTANKPPEFVGPPKPDLAVAATTPAAEPAPLPRAAIRRDPFTAAVPDPVVFATVDARLPVLFPVADATDPELVRKVKAEFAVGHALRLDLFAKDTHRAADLFRSAVSAAGNTLIVDGVTQELLKRKQRLAWAVYSESLSAADVLAVLKRLAATDAKNPGAEVWTSGHLTTASVADGKEAKELFGVDPAGWKKAKANEAPTPPADKSAKPPAGTAVLTTFLPTTLRTPPAASQQIKKFHDDKPPKKDGAVPLIIVIRPGS